jgi:hypothetical protein
MSYRFNNNLHECLPGFLIQKVKSPESKIKSQLPLEPFASWDKQVPVALMLTSDSGLFLNIAPSASGVINSSPSSSSVEGSCLGALPFLPRRVLVFFSALTGLRSISSPGAADCETERASERDVTVVDSECSGHSGTSSHSKTTLTSEPRPCCCLNRVLVSRSRVLQQSQEYAHILGHGGHHGL